jgi:nucleotidyltransferase/DNA polymerase involved in DNA repair
MDAFYASVELLRYPQLKGLPVVIGGGRRAIHDALESLRAADLATADPTEPEPPWDEAAQRAALRRIPVEAFARLSSYTGRGVITTATYAARQFGVGSAMGMMKAAKLCPQAILLPVDFEEYRRYSRQFKAIITDIAPLMEDRGVDEVYIDFTHVPGGQREGGRVLARLIRRASSGHRPDLFIGCGQQAAGKNGQRVQQAQRHCRRLRERRGNTDLAAGLPQDQRHRPQGGREAQGPWHRDHWPAGPARPDLAGAALWPAHRCLAA